jgi:hypothetical protein
MLIATGVELLECPLRQQVGNFTHMHIHIQPLVFLPAHILKLELMLLSLAHRHRIYWDKLISFFHLYTCFSSSEKPGSTGCLWLRKQMDHEDRGLKPAWAIVLETLS